MSILGQTMAVILGGGVGKRLYPLTRPRSKPAVPIAGKYRLIDVPISNCINSGIHHIAVLTQFNSASLHRHITQTYNFDSFHPGWVQILAAEQTPRSVDWYQGTADAVRKQLNEIRSVGAEYILVLAGDHLYRMDFAPMAEYHVGNKADITVAVQPIVAKDASRFGILKRSASGQITAFAEKPRDPNILAQLVSREDPERPYLGSMGIYLFNMSVLESLLENTPYDDFGGQIIPNSLDKYSVFGFDFAGFWEDIGTIRSFYETNLMLTQPDSPFNFYDPVHPIYTRPRFLPSSVIHGAKLTNVLLSDGCSIRNAEIKNSVIGLRSTVADGARVENTVMMGADFYDPENSPPPSNIPLGIGPNCVVEGAILDKNVRIGEGVIIRNFPRGADIDNGYWVVADGIVVIPKGTILHPGTYVGPD